MAAASVEIKLGEQAQKLFTDYERYTRVTPEAYISELVEHATGHGGGL
jgi:hypothetical protein